MGKNLLLITLALIVNTKLFAFDFESEGICYQITSDTTVAVTYEGWSSNYADLLKTITDLVIPSSVTNEGKTYAVTTIGNSAFSYCEDLTSITIPNSVTTIGSNAFQYCKGLTSIEIPSSVINIKSDAFSGCSSIEAISVDNGNQKYDSRDNCNAIIEKETNKLILGCNKTIMPNSVASIGDYAFYMCTELTSITLPKTLTGIGNNAFSGCNGLTSIEIPHSVTSIGEYAFQSCNELTSIEIPSSVASIGTGVFQYCNNLASATINNANIGRGEFAACSKLASVTFSDTLVNIGGNAFADCSSLLSINLPNSLTNIGEAAFDGCYKLPSIVIPSSVTNIENRAFYGCTALDSIVVADGNQKYDSRNNCNAVIETETNRLILGCGKTVIPSSVSSIGSYAFVGSAKPVEYNGATYMACGDNPYYALVKASKTSAEQITINERTKIICGSAFSSCYNLTSIVIPNSVTSLGNNAFESCSKLASIVLPNTLTAISNYTFYGCSKLESIEIPKSVFTIGNGAFKSCKGLTSVTIPDSVTKIGDEAFAFCSGLKSVSIPNSVTSIGYAAFNSCYELPSISLPSSLLNLGEHAFSGTDISNKEYNDNYYLGNSDNAYLAFMKPKKTSVKEATIDKGTKVIAFGAFSGCSSLESVNLPDSLAGISNSAFNGCSSLASIEIPGSVVFIGDSAFKNCLGIRSLTIGAKEPISISDNCFSGMNLSEIELYVPAGTKEKYLAADVWKNFDVKEQIYTVTWIVNGKTVDIDTVVYGTKPQFSGTLPKEGIFNGWKANVNGWTAESTVTSNVVLTAEFLYTVTWIVDGKTVATDTVVSGTKPQFNGTLPKSCILGGWTANVKGWTAESTITSNMVFTAELLYTVTWIVDENPIQVDTLKLGAKPTYAGLKPTKEGYTFTSWRANIDGWTEESTVAGNMTFTAEFTKNVGIADTESPLNIFANGTTIVVENARSIISIYDLNGRCIRTESNFDGIAKMQMPNQGLYIVKVGNISKRVVLQ